MGVLLQALSVVVALLGRKVLILDRLPPCATTSCDPLSMVRRGLVMPAVDTIGAVTIIDNEMSERQAIQWLKDQGIDNTAAINFVALRGKVSSFNILDADMRSRWANILRGTDYLIFDCLRPALDALGLDEQRDAGKFLQPFDELMAEANINEALIVHHMGHSSGRSRGDSPLRDWPDVEWFLERAMVTTPHPSALCGRMAATWIHRKAGWSLIQQPAT